MMNVDNPVKLRLNDMKKMIEGIELLYRCHIACIVIHNGYKGVNII